MRKKRLLSLSAILLGAIMCFSFSKVQASEITSVFDGTIVSRETVKSISEVSNVNSNIRDITLTLTESGYTDNSGKKIWKIVNLNKPDVDYYCLNMNRGFGGVEGTAEKTQDIYNYSNTLNISDLNNYAYDSNISQTTYNKILWILNNSYVRTNSSKFYDNEAYIALMNNLVKYKNNDDAYGIYSDNYYNLTEDDIITAQKLAIWYYTNNYEVSGLRNPIGGVPSDPLVDDDTADVIQYSRQQKLLALKDYFINNADSNYEDTEPTLELSNENVKVEESGNYYIAGPFKLTGTDISKIKEINAVTNKEVILLDSSKNEVANNDFLKVIGDKGFYLKLSKDAITENTNINLDITYKYDVTKITFITDKDDPENTQPVVIIEKEERTKNTKTDVEIKILDISVEKIWSDNENQDGKRPTSIKVRLYENGKTRETVTLNEKNSWKHTWNKLLANKEYTVKELDENGNAVENENKYNDNYSVNYAIEENKTIITNIHTPETINIEGTKTWVDNENQDGKRPEKIVVNLYANGKIVKSETVIPDSKGDWKYKFENLPRYEEGEVGKEIVYTIDEEVVAEYEKEIDGYNIINTHIPEITQKTVTKVWEDNDNQDGARPESIEVQLYKEVSGIKTSMGDKYKVILDADGNWSHTWTDLPKYENGTEIIYSVVEKQIDKYTTTYSEDTFTITNSYTPEKTSKTVTKIWIDEDNKDNIRPESIEVQLYKEVDGIKTSMGDEYKVTLNDANAWTYTWSGLDKYENGKEIIYSAEEINVPDGYSEEYSEDTFTITNIHIPEIPEKISKTVIKEWNDNNSIDRPREITVILYKIVNGEEVELERQKLNEANNWTYTWNDLDEKENGENIVYTVKEETVNGYETTYSERDYSNTDTIIITNTHIVVPPIEGKYNVILRKADRSGNELSGAIIKVNGKEYTVGNAVIVEDENITSVDDITLEYKIEEIKSPDGYSGLDSIKNIKIRLEIVKSETYRITRAYLVDEDGNQITDEKISVKLDVKTNTITLNVINNPIQKEFDLSLRKFITQINDQMYKREPVVDTDTIATTGTATYKHTKEPIAVQVGDIVNYTIRVYNEGETDGYASEITDYLPEWLDFLPDDEVNTKYLWQQDINNNRKITTNITSKDSASGEELYGNRENKQLLSAYNGGNTLDYIDVQIRCKVNEKAQIKQLITNIAEISEMQDKEGVEVITDRDSTKANVNLPSDADLPNYKGKESNKEDLTDKDYYYKGQEDDDDFEKVVVENFDLSLRKFITVLNDTELKNDDGTYAREPIVDTSKLGTKDENGNVITTAIYNHPKTPLQVAKGDIVTYCIRVYNEGTLAGYANQVIDNIPEGLEFIEDSSINKSNGWELKDGKIVTTYLSDANINNVINPVSQDAEGNKILSYKDVKVQFKVVAEPSKFMGELITNWAEIGEDSNNDIDSVPGNDVKEEDDIDFEPVKLVYFDLSLRKFITNVNETEYNNRVPEVDTSKMGTTDENGNKVTTATYTHTKDPIVLETGSIVTYCIRVYNEGTMPGYANEITDNIPEGLEFLPGNEINTNYKWMMLDEKGEITQDVSKAKKITTNYLSEANGKDNILAGYQEENGAISLDYKDVKVAFKVVEPNTSDRIVVNTAEISKASDEDIDSVPGNNVEGEDDIDKEYVRVETFDLALQKWVTATKVTYNGKTVTKKTGFDADSTEMAKVDLIASQLKKTTVKFVYSIRVINEGQVAGYATEIKDYVPSGLKFVKEDNPDWTLQKDGTVTTDKLKDTLLQPGQSAIVEITLTWKNSSTNMGVKTNWAEISADSGDDIDSTPDNNIKLEDDIDDAKVILSIKTGSVKMYIILSLISIAILGGGTFAIKKYVINK